MSNEAGYVQAGNEKLHYLKWGSGKRLLLAFHGYGNDAAIFLPLQEYIGNEYTILSFDLPFHGESNWAEGSLLTMSSLAAMVRLLMAEYKVDKVSLIGYSMGGRVCFTIVSCLPESIDKVTLLATDGLAINGYYYFFTRTYLGKFFFRNMLKNPRPYIKVVEWMKKRNWVHESRYRFVSYYLQSKESRKLLLKVWPAMRDLVPDPRKLRSLIKQYRIQVTIFMGKHDKIMPPVIAEKFKSGLDTVQLFILEKGHRVFDNETAQQIASSLL